MNPIFWIPIGAIVLGLLLGARLGAQSRSSTAGSGALIGLALAVMGTFPLWAIGFTHL